ncbi:MAG: outer membrane protein, partial [Beijerinckiaceae bacterium]
YDSDGWMIGGHIGYNYQINQFVVGLEGDIEWSDSKKTALYTAPIGWYHRTSMEWQASLRARFGIAFDRTLLYVTGGLAYADINHQFGTTLGGVPVAPALLSYGKDKWGWTVGAGVEHAFTNNFTARLEYRYTDFGRISAASATFADSAKVNSHAIRAGISYKF